MAAQGSGGAKAGPCTAAPALEQIKVLGEQAPHAAPEYGGQGLSFMAEQHRPRPLDQPDGVTNDPPHPHPPAYRAGGGGVVYGAQKSHGDKGGQTNT